MPKNKHYLKLRKLAVILGADLFGVADITLARKDFLLQGPVPQKMDRAVVIGVRLSSALLANLSNAPDRLYFHHYKTANAILDQLSFRLSRAIQEDGFAGFPIPASQIVDWQMQKAHLSHKTLGVLAGLGWIGRNNLLVNRKLGSQFRLASILTDMPLSADRPVKDGCGTCRACSRLCPAQAIGESPEDFQHLKCFEKLKEFQKQRLVDQFICGVCVNACSGKTGMLTGKKR